MPSRRSTSPASITPPDATLRATSASQRSDVAVIGAGIVGLSTAYSLLGLGASVTVYERGVPGNGQSGGESRIFRHAHDDPRLVALACRSRAIWREWEARLGVELVSPDGVVALGPAVEDRLRVLQEVGGVAVRPIDPAEVAQRLPLLASYSGPATFDEGGGSIRTGPAVKALADQLGTSLVSDEVISLRPVGAGAVEVRAGGDRREYRSVVVCAGRGTTSLARSVGLSLPVGHAAHVRLTFALADDDPPPRLACLQDGSGHFGETGVYAAPLSGNRQYALGLSQTVEVHEDGSLLEPEGLAALSERASAYVARALPHLDPVPVDYRHCWTTEVPWSPDGVAVWAAEPMFFVAGHNLFKHAPALGAALAQAALEGELPNELRPEARLGHPEQVTTLRR
ncbi:MAG TPA: FAD-dependent oxidoreductase [Acidimicrobiales bacterium]|nr:FAD-dependent oxidoreductase [Acidimicrobiales bacterium]